MTLRHVEARHLALVANQSGDLAIDRVGDVDDDVGLVRAPVPELAHLVRFEPVPRDLFREMQMIAGVGVDGVGRRDAGLSMVAMLEASEPIRVVNEDRVRPISPDGTDDVAEKFSRVLEPAVGIAQHDDVTHAHEVRGGALLIGSLSRERGWRQGAVRGAGRAVGAEDVGHLASRGRPLGHDASGADLGIVGVREDHHRLVGNLGHDLELGEGLVSGHGAILQGIIAATMTTNSFPLSRFKVLDLTRARAGPTCVRQLVDWGAQAIKIEMPGGRTGDGMGGNRHGFDFQNLHRNKRSMTLNLRDPEGVAIFKRLVREADVVVENYRPDVKRRLGIDYETLRTINPRIIYGSISGFGQSGPYRDRPGVDQIAQGMGGLMSITGIPGQGPVRVGIPIADLCSGIFLAQGILVALLEREVTGEGKWVHTSLLEAMLSMLDFQASRWLMSGEIPPQAGNNHPTGIPTGVFETRDGHINIAAGGDEIYSRLCHAIERPDLLTDARFATPRARSADRDVLMA